MRKKFFRIGENEKEIIQCVGLGLFAVASIAFPNLPMAIQPIVKMRGHKGLQKLLKNLERKRYIILAGEKIKLTTKGRQLVKELHIYNIKFNKTDEWDGIWRIVAYDIPEIYKKSRDLLRSVLERNDFYKIQKSLWAYPYECKEEIAVLAKNLHLLSCVVFMTTERLPNQKTVLAHFDLEEN